MMKIENEIGYGPHPRPLSHCDGRGERQLPLLLPQREKGVGGMRACYPINFLIFIIRGRKNVHRTTYRAGVAVAGVAAGVGVAVGAVGKTSGVAKTGGGMSTAP